MADHDGYRSLRGYFINLTTFILAETIRMMEGYCSEFLVHAADVEGLCQGIDEDLVAGWLQSQLPKLIDECSPWKVVSRSLHVRWRRQEH